ncbi:MAG: M50 family metallopeptidase [Patescibacteria group bacterium]
MDILIVIISLVVLITLHELGHFLFAKKFDVKVHEFGIGIPPRVIGKKIGETIYSINLLPLGGFVRMLGENEQVDDERSFSEKPAWQRAIILVAGVVSFWIVAIFIFASVSFGWGIMTEVPEDVEAENTFLYVNWVEEEIEEEINLQDRITEVNDQEITTVEDFENSLKDKNTVTVLRGDEEVEVSFEDKDKEEILSAIDLRRVAMEKKSLPQAAVFGVKQTVNVTRLQASGLWMALKGSITGEGLPEGMEFGGPVMIGDMATDALDRGAGDYLMFVGMIATVLAFMNILPIPALDGGRLVFLAIEKVKGSPIPERVEQTANAVFFLLLLGLMIVITVRDIFNIL